MPIKLSPLLERFAERTPLPVLARAVLERCLNPQALEAWFTEVAEAQSTRQLLFSTLFDLMSQGVLRQQPSIHAAWRAVVGAVLAHPQLKTVLPLAAEAITRQDGMTKNDCERNAAKRLLVQLRREYPKLKLIVVEDSLAANGPHLELLGALNLRYLIGVKEGDHEALFETVQERRLRAGKTEEFELIDDQGGVRGFRFVNDLPLNKSHPHVRVNFLEYWEIVDGQERVHSHIVDNGYPLRPTSPYILWSCLSAPPSKSR
jgi:hypothetical protein